MSLEHVAICACTMDRPAGLARLLQGIAALQRHDALATLVIVDNSPNGSARGMVDDARSWIEMPIIYAHEPRRGYSMARNRQLDAAPADAAWLAMIDDDEVPEPQWLVALLETARRSGADLVCGPLLPEFEETPPTWAIEGRFFELGPFEEGAAAVYVGAGNCLVRAEPIRQQGWRFHLDFNDTGGEDEHFFRRAMDSGLRAVTSADGRVIEHIPASRTRLRWLMKRHARMGSTIATIDRMNGFAPLRAAKALGWLIVSTSMLIAGLFSGKVTAIRGLCRIAWACGSLKTLLLPRRHLSETGSPP